MRVGLAVVALGCAGAALAQQPGGAGALPEDVLLRLAAIREAADANRAALSHYTWLENIQISHSGEVKANKAMTCNGTPDGKPQCTPVGPPPDDQPARGLIGRIKEEKKEEYVEYIQQVKDLIAGYVPPNGDKLLAARAAGNVSLQTPPGGAVGLLVQNYWLPGDSITFDFAMEAHKLVGLRVMSYLDDPSSPVSLNVQFATLPDGTNYPAQETINAAGKDIQLLITNTNYQKLAF